MNNINTNHWRQLPFIDVITTVSKNKGIKKTEYKESGKYPVIDQGQKFISAYSDNTELVGESTPKIIFGDHTRVIKFVDFLAVYGNDGVKILKPKEGIEAKFLYYQISNFDIPNTGYNRHFKFLTEKTFQVPKVQIQQKIALILSTVDDAIQKTNQIIQKAENLKVGLMHELLLKGIGHKKFKKTKLGVIPEEWDIFSLQELINSGLITSHLDGNHGELYPKAPEFTNEGIPYISANSLHSSRVDFTGSKFLSEFRAKQFKKGVALDGDVLFAHNATVGPVALLETGYPFIILSTSLTYYRCNISKLSPRYLLNYMQSEKFKNQYQRIMSQTTRNQVPITAQRTLLHVIPPFDEQNKIADILSAVDVDLLKNNAEKDKLINLKNGLMQDIFSQKVQIN